MLTLSRLHIAAKHGLVSITELLLSHGADPNMRDQFGFSAAYIAKESNKPEVMELLPKPQKITTKQYGEHREQHLKAHIVVDRRKKGRKKGRRRKKR